MNVINPSDPCLELLYTNAPPLISFVQIQGEGQVAKVLTTQAAIPIPNGATIVTGPQITTKPQVYRGLVGTVSTIVKQEGPR